MPNWPAARIVAFVLFIIAAVVSFFADTADGLVILGIISAGLAAWTLA